MSLNLQKRSRDGFSRKIKASQELRRFLVKPFCCSFVLNCAGLWLFVRRILRNFLRGILPQGYPAAGDGTDSRSGESVKAKAAGRGDRCSERLPGRLLPRSFVLRDPGAFLVFGLKYQMVFR